MFGLGTLQLAGIGLLALLLSSGGAYFVGYERGHRIAILEIQAESLKAITKAVEEARALQIAEDAITNEIGKHEAEARERIVTKTITQIKQVPIYVTQKADAACTVPRGFVLQHDAAASGNASPALPDAPGGAVDSASGVALSGVAETVIENYGTCYKIRGQLMALQDWVRQQQALHR